MPTFANVRSYNRDNALNYALKWALLRNPRFYDFSNLGGDCTNFASQVIYAGAGVMNYTPVYGWYYINANQKSPSWTGVNYLYNFLVSNRSKGPFAEEVSIKDIQLGDLIQISFVGNNVFNHSLIITRLEQPLTIENIYFATHSPNFLHQKLTHYHWVAIRFIHFKGVYV